MADAVSHTSKAQTSLSSDPPNINPSKFYSNFLYKAALVTVILVLLPLFPSIAPEFINQTLHARSWELLQLIFVGIAVSYGLFSRRNDETEKDNGGSKHDNPQSYVTKLLQVSSVFDDESESQTIIEENKVQTLNSQHYRGEPVVVVAKQSPVVTQENGCEISQKPLLLPVRSLKQRVAEPSEGDLGDESGGKNGLINNRSRFTSNSRKPRNVEVGGLSFRKLDEKLDENVVVLRSPIPWRSRSGRMEMKEDIGDGLASMDEIELNRIDESTFVRSSSKNLSTPKKLTPSTSFPSESQAKTSEDDVVRRNYYFSSSPPPPPPAPQFVRKSVLSKSNSTFTNNAVSPEKVLRRSVPAEELSESEMEEEFPRRMNAGSESNLMRGRIQNDGLVKSVRTYRPTELVAGAEKEFIDYETTFVEKKGYTDTMANRKFTDEAKGTYVEFPKEEMVEKVMMETSDEDSEAESTEEEDDCFKGSSGNEEAATDNNSSVNDVGPDVDKKADEFIAKFREQIRLQRIESIRRSTAQGAGKTLR